MSRIDWFDLIFSNFDPVKNQLKAKQRVLIHPRNNALCVINATDYGNAQQRRRVFIFATRHDTYHSGFDTKSKLNDAFKASTFKWISEKGFFTKTFPVEKQHNAEKKTSFFSLTGYTDLVDVTDSFKATFCNSGLMVDGLVYSEEMTPKYLTPITLSEIIENGPVDDKYYITGECERLNGFPDDWTNSGFPRRHRCLCAIGRLNQSPQGGFVCIKFVVLLPQDQLALGITNGADLVLVQTFRQIRQLLGRQIRL